VVATSDVLNALNDGVGRLSRRPFWVGAFAFLLFSAVGMVALMSVAIGVLATLRVAYTTSIDRVSNVTPPTDQRLAERQSRPQIVPPISPVVLPHDVSARPEVATDPAGSTLSRSDLSSPETAQPAASTDSKPGASTTAARPVEDPARSTLTDLIEAQSPPTPPATAALNGGNERHPNGSTASPAAAESGASASSSSASEPTPAAPSVGSPRAADVASTSGSPETDEIGRLATAPLPIEVTAAAFSHLRHALRRRTQGHAIKHTVHKPAPPPSSRAALQNNNYRPFDPFQQPTPSAAGASTHQKSW
jgi:hypothetical protein